jgi:hypothetical protein
MIATTNLIGATAKRTIEAQEKQASVVLLGDLEAAEVDWPASAGAGMPRFPNGFACPAAGPALPRNSPRSCTGCCTRWRVWRATDHSRRDELPGRSLDGITAQLIQAVPTPASSPAH